MPTCYAIAAASSHGYNDIISGAVNLACVTWPRCLMLLLLPLLLLFSVCLFWAICDAKDTCSM